MRYKKGTRNDSLSKENIVERRQPRDSPSRCQNYQRLVKHFKRFSWKSRHVEQISYFSKKLETIKGQTEMLKLTLKMNNLTGYSRENK